MTTTSKVKAAEALAPILRVFRSVDDKPLRAVSQVWTEGSLEKLILDFGHVSLVLDADENDDSINLTALDSASARNPRAVDAGQLDPWKDLIGKPFGWGWLTINQQGYCDGLLLSFHGILPQVILNVIGSSIKVGKVSLITDRQ